MLQELPAALERAGIKARFATPDDRPSILRAYSQSLGKAKENKAWLQRLTDEDVEYVTDSVLSYQEAYPLIIDEQFLVAFRINNLWFRPSEKCLEEFSVLRLNPGSSSMRRGIKAMEVAAKFFGCVSINSGTALSADNERVANVYRRSGFQQDAITLWKAVGE